MRWLLAFLCLSFVAVTQASTVETLDGKVIEKVLVLKSAHQLQLINDGKPIKTYRISLGKNPKGQKLMEGDRRTPEGFYWLDWRKVSDRFNLAMHISYPNISDAARSRREGVNPGGMIMIHGTPDTEENPEDLFHTLDWTDGCIAMRNVDMREVWGLVPDGTMIGVDPVQDRERFYVSENGVTLVTASMLRAPARSGGGPVSVGVGGSTGSYGSGLGVGIGLNLSGPPPEQVETELAVAIRDRKTDKVLWEGRASFTASVGDDVNEAIQAIETKLGRKPVGYVLDMRSNPGGLLDEAVGISDLFLERGEIVSQRGRKKGDIERYFAEPGDLAGGLSRGRAAPVPTSGPRISAVRSPGAPAGRRRQGVRAVPGVFRQPARPAADRRMEDPGHLARPDLPLQPQAVLGREEG